MSEDMLMPHNKLPIANVTTILLVGDQGTGKHQLAKALVETKTTFSLQVRTATSLPLPPDTAGTRQRIDLVVFIVDLTNLKSMSVAAKCVTELDVHYFHGKCCFVACNVTEGARQTVEIEGITQLANSYHCQLFSVSMKNEKSRAALASHILGMAVLSSGFSLCPSLLVGATQTFSQAHHTKW